MAETKIITGNQAAAHAVRLARTQVVSAYPITPQTTVMEALAKMWSDGEFGGEYVNVESENSALAYCVGAAYAGARAFTASSSHGLAYMHELLHWAAGARLPLVMTVANRTLGAPWCIETDQTDSLSQRDTGWIQLYCSSAQEILDSVLLGFRLAEEVRLPVMVCYDGFYLSHTYEAVDIPAQDLVDRFLPLPASRPAIDMDAPRNWHTICSSEVMAPLLRQRFAEMWKVPGKFAELEESFSRVLGRRYGAVEFRGAESAGTIFVTAGAMAQTVKSFLAGHAEGLARIKLFRPFPAEEFWAGLCERPVERLIVLDRNVGMGVGGIFAHEVRSALYGRPCRLPVYEVNLAGGLDLTPEMLEKVLEKVDHMSDTDQQIIWAVDLA